MSRFYNSDWLELYNACCDWLTPLNGSVKGKASCRSSGRKDAMMVKGGLTGGWKDHCRLRNLTVLAVLELHTGNILFHNLFPRIKRMVKHLYFWPDAGTVEFTQSTTPHSHFNTNLCNHSLLLWTAEHIFCKNVDVKKLILFSCPDFDFSCALTCFL